MKTAWDPAIEAGFDPVGTSDCCPRCGRADHREHLLQTAGVAFYRCAACGHMFIVRTAPRQPDTSTA